MKKHDYLNLKSANVEQYSMVIKKKDLKHWQSLGWAEFTEIGLPEGDEQAWMLYGKMKKSETLIFNRPTLLRNIETDKIIGRRVIDVTCYLGTYGMGGAGFFGLLLDTNEYLVYTVWSSGEYVIIDNRVVDCSSDLYEKAQPWLLNGEEALKHYLTNSTITDYSFTNDTCTLYLKKEGKTIEIIFVKNDSRLPKKSARKKNAFRKGIISDYLLFQHKDGVLIV